MDEVDRLDAFLGVPNAAPHYNDEIDKLDAFLGVPESTKPFYEDAYDSFRTGLGTGLSRGLHGYFQNTLESDRGAFREINDKAGTALMGPLGKLSGAAIEQLAKYLTPEQLQRFNQTAKSASEKMSQERNAKYAEASQKSPYAAGTGDFIGNLAAMAPTLAINPFNKAKLGGQVANNALQNMIAAQGNYVEGNSPLRRAWNTAFSGVLGATAPLATRGAEATGRFADDLFSDGPTNAINKAFERIAAPNVFLGVDPEKAITVKKAGERLGMHLSPAEASGSQIAAETQGRIGTSKRGAISMQKYGDERLAQERNVITNFKNKLAPATDDAPLPVGYQRPDDLYKSAYGTEVSTKDFNKVIANPIVSKYWNMAKKDVLNSEDISKYGENSFAALDLTKQKIDDAISSASGKNLNNKVRKLENARKSLVSTMDSLSDDYAPARQMAQRDIVRRNIENDLNNIEAGGKEFYKNQLVGDKEFKSLINTTKNVPGAGQDLQDMRASFANLINPRSVPGSAGLAKSSLNVPRSDAQYWVTKIINGITAGKYDEAMAKLVANPKWDEVLLKLNQMPNVNHRNLLIANMLSKAAETQVTEPKR